MPPSGGVPRCPPRTTRNTYRRRTFPCPAPHPARRAPPQRLAYAPASHREGRLQEPDHRRRLDPGQDRPRRPNEQAGYGISGIRPFEAQGLSRPRAFGRSCTARRLACSSPLAPIRTVLGLPPLPPWPNAEAVSESAQELSQPGPAPGSVSV